MNAQFSKTSYLNIAYEAIIKDYMMPQIFHQGLTLRYMIMLWHEVSMKIIMRFIKDSNMFPMHNISFVVAREITTRETKREKVYAQIFTTLAKNAAHILLEHDAYSHNQVRIRGDITDKPVFKGTTFEILHDADKFVMFTTFLALHRVESYEMNEHKADNDFLKNVVSTFKRMSPAVLKRWGPN